MRRQLARAESDISVVTEGFSDAAGPINHAMDDRALVAEGFVDTIRNHVDGILTQSVRMSRRVSAQTKTHCAAEDREDEIEGAHHCSQTASAHQEDEAQTLPKDLRHRRGSPPQ